MDRIQTSLATAYMREPVILRAAHAWLDGRFKDPNILSFGCSIGDELATLRTFFPTARIQGCDVDPLALKVARRTVGSLAEVFPSRPREIARRGPFHLICAFSSLCINPPPPNLTERFPFERFAELVEMFSSLLVPGGILALFNTSYLFAHTPAARSFDNLRPDTVVRNGWVDVYAPDGRRILQGKATPASYAQIVDSADAVSDDWELIDCLHIKRGRIKKVPKVVEMTLYDPKPDLQFTSIAEWKRSDLDSLPPDRKAGYIDVRHAFRLLRAKPADKGLVWLEEEIWRDSVCGAPPIRIGMVGRNALR